MDGCAQFSQKGRICLKKWKWILLIALVVIILSFFIFISPVFSLSVKPSDVDPDFPIPSQSERVERSEADPSWTLYEIAPLSAAHSLIDIAKKSKSGDGRRSKGSKWDACMSLKRTENECWRSYTATKSP